MIDFAAGWADLEPPCCSSNSRRIWEDVGVPLLLYAPIHSNPPRPTYKSHLRPVIQKKPSQLILRQFTQDNVTLHTRKPRRWKMCIRRAAVTYVSAVSAPSTHRRALNPSLNTVTLLDMVRFSAFLTHFITCRASCATGGGFPCHPECLACDKQQIYSTLGRG